MKRTEKILIANTLKERKKKKDDGKKEKVKKI